MATVTHKGGNDFIIPEESQERIQKSLASLSEVFHSKATDGKIVNAQAMEVYYDLLEVSKAAGIVTEEEIEDVKSFDGTFQAVVEVCDVNNDGFIDFEEFKTLIMEAKAVYIEELFKTYDLNLDGFITQDEMDTVVAGIEKPIRAKKVRELFDMLLANFDADGDGRLSLAEFTGSMKSMKW